MDLGREEKDYRANITTLQEKVRALSFEKDLQAQDAEGERKRLICENDTLKDQLQQINSTPEYQPEAGKTKRPSQISGRK